MSGYTEMVRLMKRAAVDAVESGKPCDVLFGTVQGVAPLEIFVEMGMVLQADELIVGERLTDHTVDEVLAVYMRSPHSYTAEDVVEIQCHGKEKISEFV